MSLEELERDMLRGARRELTPAASDRDRHHAQLLARLGTAHAGDPLAVGVRSGSSSGSSSGASWGRAGRLPLRESRFGALGVGLLVGAMVGAVVGGWFGFGLGRGWWGGAPRGPSSTEMVVPGGGRTPEGSEVGGDVGAAASPATSAAMTEHAPPAAEPPPTQEPALVADGVKPSSSEPARAGHGAVAPRPRPARSESSLAAELAMLQRARRALAAENGGLALGIVEELDERFPKGVLLEERTATRVLSLCKLEQIEAARREALRFLERYPASVYAERVRQACAGTASE